MNIETRYAPGDFVYTIKTDQIEKVLICELGKKHTTNYFKHAPYRREIFDIRVNKTQVLYTMQGGMSFLFRDKELYSTMEACLKECQRLNDLQNR